MKYVILGNGYVGNYLAKHLPNSVLHTEKVWLKEQIVELMLNTHPSSVLVNCAGKIGKPNVDWCEDNKAETFGGNVGLPVMLAETCKEIKQPWIHIGSGCIYDGYDKVWTEDDEPNFTGSFYSKTKVWSQRILEEYDEVCVLRVRMPIDEEISDRSFVGKLVRYATAGNPILSLPNSVTFLSDLVMMVICMAEKGQTGTFNAVNPQSLTAENVFELWQKHIDDKINPQYQDAEKVLATLKAGRSNCVLSTRKMEMEGVASEDAYRKLESVLINLAKRRKENGSEEKSQSTS